MAEKHFFEQENYTNEYFLPYFKDNITAASGEKFKVLEVGCAEGGFLAVMNAKGFDVKGVEISAGRVSIAKKKLKDDIEVVIGDVSDASTLDFSQQYDLVVLRDVIEHVSDQQSALDNIYKLVKDQGHLFITFPLKHSPYAGHQQSAKSGLKYIWFITLFPAFIIKILCNLFNDKSQYEEIIYLKKHALTYARLNRMLAGKWKYIRKDFYISRPIYKIRFGWKIIKSLNVPIIREVSNGCEVLAQKC